MTRKSATEGSIKGINELQYNWKFGHAPVDGNENKNCIWQKERKERSDITDRETIRKALIGDANIKPPILRSSGASYEGSSYALKRLSTPYKTSYSLNFDKTMHGGVNFSANKNRDFFRKYAAIHGKVSSIGVPQNVP